MSAHDEVILEQGLNVLGVSLSSQVKQRLLVFGQLLLKWNKVYNLTAIRQPEEVLTLHLLDSLAVLPYLSGVRTLADIGSGGGLPGIPLAIACPDLRVSSIEAVNKKAAFQQQARIELDLVNLNVMNERVEHVQVTEPFDGVISRAFSSLSDFVTLAGVLAGETGRLYAMKGVYPEAEMAELPTGWKVSEVIQLKVPQLDAERHLVVLMRG